MNKVLKFFFSSLLLFFVAGVVPALAKADWVGNSAIQLNGTWYYAGQNALEWCSGGDFKGQEFEQITGFTVGAQSEIWEEGNVKWGVDGTMKMYLQFDDNEPMEITLLWADYENNNNILKTGGQYFSLLKIDISHLSIGKHTIGVKFEQDGVFDPANGYTVATFTKVLTGSGTEGLPYLIHSTTELDYLAAQVNSGNGFENVCFKLDDDLDYTGKTYTPIGTKENPFKGIFDGNGKTISGISLNGGDYLGAFGHVFGDNCLIQNLKVNGSITGRENVGGIVGYSYGSNIIGCSNAATVIGNYAVGGIVGSITNGEVIDCLSEGNVQGSTSATDVGGIVGFCDNASVKASLCSASVSGFNFVGGIVGTINRVGSIMQACLFTGNSVSGQSRVGALIGHIMPDEFLLSNNYYTTVDIGGAVGEDYAQSDGAVRGYILDASSVTSDIIGQETGEHYSLNGLVSCKNGLKYGDDFFVLKFVPLYNNGIDNLTAINRYDGKTATVKLIGRTLFTDGDWNTLCLPFDVEGSGEGINYEGTPLDGATVMTLVDSEFEDGTLTLDFEVPSYIRAGEPYIVKWEENNELEDIFEPEFNNVSIVKMQDIEFTMHSTDFVDFIGCFNSVSFATEDPNTLYLGANNTLYYPNGAMDIDAFRAYFKLHLEGVGKEGIKAFKLNFGDEEMGIKSISLDSSSYNDGGWYTLDGRRLQEKPAASGIYIHNGCKTVIKY